MKQSNQPQSALPDEWVVRIFEHMACTYGTRFADLWAGQEPETVRAYWGRKLGGFDGEAIKAALDALDDRPFPPTLPEFIALCRAAANRRGSYVALPAPQMSREEAATRAQKLGVSKRDGFDGMLWAKKLREKYIAGERLYPIQIRMASEALGEVWSMGKVEITMREAA